MLYIVVRVALSNQFTNCSTDSYEREEGHIMVPSYTIATDKEEGFKQGIHLPIVNI